MDKIDKCKTPCLTVYLNQARYPRAHNERQLLLSEIIKNFVHNYFIEYHTKETSIWKRFIKTMLKEMEYL